MSSAAARSAESCLRQAGQLAPVGLGNVAHRRVERSRSPHDVGAEPEHVDPAATRVAVGVEPVDLIGNDPQGDAQEQKTVGRRAPSRPHEKLRESDEQQSVHRRVGHRNDTGGFRREVDVVVLVDEEDPLDERDTAEDDDAVQDGRASALCPEATQDEEDPGREQRVAGEVEDVSDRRRRRLAVQVYLVEREDRIPRDLAEQSERKELPR